MEDFELEIETCCVELGAVASNTVDIDLVEVNIQKSASCGWTMPGGVITFCNLITNQSETDLEQVIFRDKLDTRFQYVQDSFTVDGVSKTPTVDNNTIVYCIDFLQGQSCTNICFKVKTL
ncbi:MAG: hypothetical protein FWC00_00050 [Firmicutes bacterium]|nr:hypothetical protein [Bacillota bacterium]